MSDLAAKTGISYYVLKTWTRRGLTVEEIVKRQRISQKKKS